MNDVYKNGDPIDVDKLILAVREIAAENPVFRYSGGRGDGECAYTLEDGTPDCIIGRAMARIGQPLPPQRVDECNDCILLDGPVNDWAVLREGNKTAWLRITNSKVAWLGVVQCYQDRQVPWGQAVNRADTAYPLD